MYARVTTVWVPPSRLEEAVRFLRDEAMPAMRSQPGQEGIWLLADRPGGRLVAIGVWQDLAELEATNFLYQELRDKVGSLYGGPPIEESYVARPPETGVYAVRATPRRRDSGTAARMARLTTVRGDPGRIEDLVRQFEAQSAPVLERLPGYLGLYLLVDAETGAARSVAFWQSPEALSASDAAVAPLRARASETMGAGASPTVELFDVAAVAAGDSTGEPAGTGRDEGAER